MDAKASTTNRLDHLDGERFRDMVASPPFAILRQKLEACLLQARCDCERGDDLRDIHRAQGRVAALRMALALPEQILKEIKAP